MQAIRAFFTEAGVLEVETPVLARHAGTDPVLDPFVVTSRASTGGSNGPAFLQTSPEFAMKRLLAAGSGPIFQITKAFRDGEMGRHHNPEFTLLEWYRPGFHHHRLMDEVTALARHCLGMPDLAEERISYRALFLGSLGIDPLEVTVAQLRALALQVVDGVAHLAIDDRDGWLQLLMTHHIEPQLRRDRLTFVYDYPRSQAALARLDPHDGSVANRFELYFQGLELANGFNELRDAAEQQRRFLSENRTRQRLGKPPMVIDGRLLDALRHGLPEASGVALGVDRLLMAHLALENIEEVVSFGWSRA